MNDKERLEIWKRKLVQIDSKVKKLDNHRNILINLLNEAKTRRNIKLNSSLKGLNLEEEVLHLKDWIRFHEKESSIYQNKICAVEESSQQEILEQELEDLEKGPKSIQEKEKYEQEKSEETLDAEIPTPEELEKDVEKLSSENEKLPKEGLEKPKVFQKGLEMSETQGVSEHTQKSKISDESPTFLKEEIKVEVDDELKLELAGLEEDAELETRKERSSFVNKETSKKFPVSQKSRKDFSGSQKPKVSVKPEFMVAGRNPVKEDEKEITAITRLFDERPEIKAVRQQIRELFKDKKDIIRPSWFKEKLTSIKEPINNAYKTLRSWKPQVSYNNKFVIYTAPIILLLLITGILFISEPEITGYVTVTQEKTYTDNLDLVINESGNHTWTTDKIGDIQSIKASGRVKGNGTVKIYIENDGQRYLIYDNEKN